MNEKIISHTDWLKLPDDQRELYGPEVWEYLSYDKSWKASKSQPGSAQYDYYSYKITMSPVETRQVHYLQKPLSDNEQEDFYHGIHDVMGYFTALQEENARLKEQVAKHESAKETARQSLKEIKRITDTSGYSMTILGIMGIAKKALSRLD